MKAPKYCENCDGSFNYKRVTMNDIYEEKISKIKKEFEEDKQFRFRITDKDNPRELLHIVSNCLEQLGIKIEAHEIYDDGFILPGMINRGRVMDVRISQLSDHHFHRILESKTTEKRVESKVATIGQFTEEKRKLIKNNNGLLDWSKGNSFEEAQKLKRIAEENKKKEAEILSEKEVKISEYSEKIKWFCEKYKEDYEIIYESLKDDDLDNIQWKGEKVDFPDENYFHQFRKNS